MCILLSYTVSLHYEIPTFFWLSGVRELMKFLIASIEATFMGNKSTNTQQFHYYFKRQLALCPHSHCLHQIEKKIKKWEKSVAENRKKEHSLLEISFSCISSFHIYKVRIIT